MKAKKDPKTGKWIIQYRYTDWQGERKKSTKRGFDTKREAEDWLRNFLVSKQSELNMSFEQFVKIYFEDVGSRFRSSTIDNKKYIINLKILPYFAKKGMSDITPADIRKWENKLISYRDENGNPYKETYLRAIYNQINSIFNYAVKYYDLKSNPCRKAGSIGKNRADEMKFWTNAEFEKFIEGVIDKQKSYVAFMTLFWTGMRLGELLALTPADVDFDNKTIRINKTFNYKEKKAGPTKTYASTRTISAPEFLLADIKDYMNTIYGLKNTSYLFQITKYYLEHEMQRGIKNSGVKRIRIHDLRHSHCALLFEMGIPPLEVKERLGHRSIDTTMNIYAHVYPGKEKQISDKLEKIYKEGI